MADMNPTNPRNPDSAQDIIYARQNTSEALQERDLIENRRYVTGANWLDTNTTHNLLLENDSDTAEEQQWFFVSSEVAVSAAHTIQRFYNPTLDTRGTGELVQSSQSNGAAPSYITATSDSSFTDSGDAFPVVIVGGGDVPARYQFGAQQDYDTLVKPGDSVLFEIVNTSGANQDESVKLNITTVPADYIGTENRQ